MDTVVTSKLRLPARAGDAVSGHYLLAKSYWQIRGFVHAHRVQQWPRRWIWIWSTLAFVVFLVAAVVSSTVTWTAVDLALKNVSVGDIVPKVILNKWQSWNRIYRPERRN